MTREQERILDAFTTGTVHTNDAVRKFVEKMAFSEEYDATISTTMYEAKAQPVGTKFELYIDLGTVEAIADLEQADETHVKVIKFTCEE